MKRDNIMSDAEYAAWLQSLVTGSIHGMWRIAADFSEREPDKYPMIDDPVMFDVAILLAATVIEGNPEYLDEKRFGKGADIARATFLEHIRYVRRLSEARGTRMIYAHIEKATGEDPVPHSTH